MINTFRLMHQLCVERRLGLCLKNVLVLNKFLEVLYHEFAGVQDMKL